MQLAPKRIVLARLDGPLDECVTTVTSTFTQANRWMKRWHKTVWNREEHLIVYTITFEDGTVAEGQGYLVKGKYDGLPWKTLQAFLKESHPHITPLNPKGIWGPKAKRQQEK